jgi:CheY-like chemotaxis protein
MQILLIEDDNFKQELVEEVLRETYPQISLRVGRSVQQALRLLGSDTCDLIVLDIALPSHEIRPGGAQPISQPSGGIEVLLELSYEGRSEKIIIVTQYPEIEYDGRFYNLNKAREALSKMLNVNIIDVIYFNPQGKSWRDQFRRALL